MRQNRAPVLRFGLDNLCELYTNVGAWFPPPTSGDNVAHLPGAIVKMKRGNTGHRHGGRSVSVCRVHPPVCVRCLASRPES